MFEALDVNWMILYFVYGQVFFIMGLAIALQLRGRRSHLELARSLPWLAGFGVAHGLTEWGYIFIPLQARYLPPWLVALSRVAHLALLAFSFFACFSWDSGLSSATDLPAPGWRCYRRWCFWCGLGHCWWAGCWAVCRWVCFGTVAARWRAMGWLSLARSWPVWDCCVRSSACWRWWPKERPTARLGRRCS